MEYSRFITENEGDPACEVSQLFIIFSLGVRSVKTDLVPGIFL